MSLNPKRILLISDLARLPRRIVKSGLPDLDKFRLKILSKTQEGGFAGLRIALRSVAMERSEQMTPEDVVAGIEKFGLTASVPEVEHLFKMVDLEQNGYLTYDGFIKGVRPELSMRCQGVVLDAYRQLDNERKGQVSVKTMYELYDPSNHPDVIAGIATEQQVVDEFVSAWGRDESDYVGQDDFFNYCADIGADMDDDYFELLVRNAWHVSGGEGLCRNTSCLRVAVTYKDGRTQIVEIKNDLHVDRNNMNEIKARLDAQGYRNIINIQYEEEDEQLSEQRKHDTMQLTEQSQTGHSAAEAEGAAAA